MPDVTHVRAADQVFDPRFTITNAITADLTTIERARRFLQAATLSEEWVRRMSQQLTLEQSERAWALVDRGVAEAAGAARAIRYRLGINGL